MLFRIVTLVGLLAWAGVASAQSGKGGEGGIAVESKGRGDEPGEGGRFEEDWERIAYLDELENEILREQNLARTKPRRYASFLEELVRHFRGNLFERPGRIAIQTNEGARAVREAIAFLRDVDEVSPLSVSRGMSMGARDHVHEQGPTGQTGHVGSDRSQPWERINRYGQWQVGVAENISYGSDEARQVVMQLIVDDGVPGRGHRTTIFEPAYTVTGVDCGYHSRYEVMCVITYAGSYIEGGGNPGR